MYESALLAQFLRAGDTARGVVTLADHGHGELALGAARVGFEQAVAAYWMAIDAGPRAAQYQRFIAWEQLKAIELLQALGVEPPRPAAEVREIVEKRRALAAGFRVPRLGWTQLGLHDQCVAVGKHWKTPEALTQLPRFEKLAHTLGNRGAHAGPEDAAHRLTHKGQFDPRLGPHERTHVFSGFALYMTGWSFGCTTYLLARDLRVTKADAWHAFFWPLVTSWAP